MRDPLRAFRSCGSDRVALRYRLRPFDVYACDACTIWLRHPLPDARELVAMYEDRRYGRGLSGLLGSRRGGLDVPALVR